MQPQPPPSRALHRGRTAALALLACALPLPGCTHAARERFEGTRPAEALVQVLPPDAQVVLDGQPLGPGDRAVPVPVTDAAPHALEVTAPGYDPERRDVPPGALPGARVGVALVPEGCPGPVELDAAEGLLRAALCLLEQGRGPEAVPYARRAVEVEPELPVARRVLGQALAAAGDWRAAADALGEYLRLAPEAPDVEAAAALRRAALEQAAAGGAP
ncbi:MAG: hypothetical protein QM767_07235 [Anaeromyxobacter sp.]